MLAWWQGIQRSAGSVDDIYFTVRDTNGAQIRGVTKFTNDAAGSTDAYYYSNITGLTNNRALLSWSRSGNSGDIYYAVLDSAGNTVKASTNLSNDGTSQWDWMSDTAQLADGRTVVAWIGNNYPSYRIRYAVLDTSYNRVSGPTLLNNPAAVTGDAYVSVAPAGNSAVLTWLDYNSFYRRNLYYALIKTDGTQLTPPQVFHTSQAGSPYLETNYYGNGNTSSSVFQPNPDGYNFNNTSRPLPSWDFFKTTFSNSDLEYLLGIPKPRAWHTYQNDYRESFEGMCDGMASTSLAYFNGMQTRPPGSTRTYEIPPNAAWTLIELYHGRQLSKGLQDFRNNVWRNNPGVDGVFNEIKARLPVWSNDPFVLSFSPGPDNNVPDNQRFGHSVVPYWIEEQPGAWAKVYVYDSNHPNSRTKYFYFDFQSPTHSFDYDMGFAIPFTDTTNYHVRSGAGWEIVLTPLSEFATYNSKVLHDGFFGWLIGQGEVVHSNAAGQQLGYVQGRLTSTIPKSAPMYQWIRPGADITTIGFSLPAGEYQAAINNSGNYEYMASSPTTAINLRVQIPSHANRPASNESTGVDYLVLAADTLSATYTSTLPTEHGVSLQVASDQPDASRQYGVSNATMTGLGSMHVEGLADGLYVQTAGMTSTFDLQIQGPDNSGWGWFIHRGITLTSGAVMTIEAPSLASTSAVTISVAAYPGGPIEHVWVLGNQVKHIFLPLIRR